jgi:hypothetical protein
MNVVIGMASGRALLCLSGLVYIALIYAGGKQDNQQGILTFDVSESCLV